MEEIQRLVRKDKIGHETKMEKLIIKKRRYDKS